MLRYCNKTNQKNKKKVYLEFYKTNLENGKAIIRDIQQVKMTIREYLDLKMNESEEQFEESIEQEIQDNFLTEIRENINP